MELNEFFNYKNRLMEDICKTKPIIQLLTGKSDPSLPATDLIYEQIFPYEFLPDTEDKAKSFICFDADITEVGKTIYMPVLYIWVFCHKSSLRIPGGGVLPDELAKEVNKKINGSRLYGLGALDLYGVHRFSPADDFLGRVLTYKATDWYKGRNYKHPIPAKREIEDQRLEFI